MTLWEGLSAFTAEPLQEIVTPDLKLDPIAGALYLADGQFGKGLEEES